MLVGLGGVYAEIFGDVAATSTSSRSIRCQSLQPARWPSTPAWFREMLTAQLTR